jgi:hypothetical protein
MSGVYGGVTGEAVAVPVSGVPAEIYAADPAARLAALFDAHHERLYRLARRLSSDANDARDLVQDTFLRAAKARGSVPTGADSEEACRSRAVIDTTFEMDIGETVVVGTSRVRGGDKALIALLTAVPKGTTLKRED